MSTYRRSPFPGCRLVAASAMLAVLAGGCGTAVTSQSAGQPASAQTLVFANPTPWGSNWSYNPFSSSFLTDLNDVALVPLAIATPPRYGTYYPELATSWTVSPTRISLALRHDAHWQNGSPVTSKDVLTDLLLEGVAGNSVWTDITSVSTPTPHSLVVDLKPGSATSEMLDEVLSLYPLPRAEYRRFLVPRLEADLLGHYPTTSTQARTLSRDLQALEHFQPKKLVSDGPYKVVAGTSQSIRLTKSSTFWDSADVHVKNLIFLDFSSASNTFPAMFSHRIDLTNTGMPAPMVHRWEQTSEAHYITTLGADGWALYFNDRAYPFDILAVRQAIAYAIDRPKMLTLSFGGEPPGVAASRPDGLLENVARTWLTSKQLKSLNPYSYNPTKAAHLLTRLHFSRRNGQWMMPNGHPFTVAIDAPAGWSAVIEMRVVASMLTNFGIKATAYAVEQPGYWTQQSSGQFDLSYGFDETGGLNPLAELGSVLVSENFVPAAGHGAASPGIGFGPSASVPGLGRVNVPSTLTAEENSVNPGARMRQLTWDWARLVNQQLPYLPYADQYAQLSFSTRKLHDWPSKKSYLWDLMGVNVGGGLLVMMQHGYIR